MLKNVCDSCGSVIDGTPVRRDYPEVMLVVDDEIELVYENLCEMCRGNLKKVLSDISDLSNAEHDDSVDMGVAAAQARDRQDVRSEVEPEPTPEHDVETETAEYEVEEDSESGDPGQVGRTEDAPKGQKPAKRANRELANQVVKQYPINLKKHDGS